MQSSKSARLQLVDVPRMYPSPGAYLDLIGGQSDGHRLQLDVLVHRLRVIVRVVRVHGAVGALQLGARLTPDALPTGAACGNTNK